MAIHKYTQLSLEIWLSHLERDWQTCFSKDELDRGRRRYCVSNIGDIELNPQEAIIYCGKRREALYVVVEWEESRPCIRSSSSDLAISRVIAIAGLYEIEELVCDLTHALPTEDAVDESEKPPIVIAKERSPADEESLSIPRELELTLSVSHDGLLMDAFWRSDGQSDKATIDEEDSSDGVLTLVEREHFIRLTRWAHRAGFRFIAQENQYRLSDWQKAVKFVCEELEQWQSKFAMHLEPDVLALSKGVQDAGPKVKATMQPGGRVQFDWLVELDGEEVSLEEAKHLVYRDGYTIFREGKGLFSLPDASSQANQRWLDGIHLFKKDSECPSYLIFSLFDSTQIKLELSEELEAWRENLAHENVGEAIVLPAFLRPYQAYGVRWLKHLCQQGCHPLLADEMGLGKTLQVMTLLQLTKTPAKPSLVVCPASVIGVWQAEVAKFYPHLNISILRKGNEFTAANENIIWLSSYTQLRRHRHLLNDIEFEYAVLDEAQFIKNPDAKVSQACLRIKAEHRVALTGTPVENRLLDLWMIFRFLMPGLLPNRHRFELACRANDGGLFNKRLAAQLSPFILRRTKSKVAPELPNKVCNQLLCPLTSLQKNQYQGIVAQSKSQYGSRFEDFTKKDSLNFLSILTRLRQACCDPALIPGTKADWQASGKLGVLLERMSNLVGSHRRIVIFSQFVRFLDRASLALEETFPSLPQLMLTGKTKNREKVVDEFQKHNKAAVILVSLRAGGTGITLHNADYVFLLDPWWNPAVEEQAIDRVHRIGQDKTVFVYRLVTQGTIEEKIQDLKLSKRQLLDDALSGVSKAIDL